MKILNIFMLILLVLSMCFALSACSDDNEVTAEVINELPADIKEQLLRETCPTPEEKVCPVQECPEPEPCNYTNYENRIADLKADVDKYKERYNERKEEYPYKECDSCCEKCVDFGSSPVEIELEDMKLYKQDKPDVEEHVKELELTEQQQVKLGTVELTFFNDCESSSDYMYIKINDYQFYKSRPKCQEETTVTVPKSKFVVGKNQLVFYSDVKESYRIEDIELDIEYTDDEVGFEDYGYIRFEVRELEEMKVVDLADKEIRNYIEYEFDLTRDDVDEEMVLKFNADEIKGKVYIYANGKQIFFGDIEETKNEIVLPEGKMISGKNTIKIVGVR